MSLPRRKIRTVGSKKRVLHKVHAPLETALRKGDTVMVIAGGNKKKQKLLKGQVGKILRFYPKTQRVVVEGLNIIKRHKRAMSPNEASGVITKEGSVHISKVMYYSESLKRPVRLKFKLVQNEKGKGKARRVRGFMNPKTKSFEQIDA